MGQHNPVRSGCVNELGRTREIIAGCHVGFDLTEHPLWAERGVQGLVAGAEYGPPTARRFAVEPPVCDGLCQPVAGLAGGGSSAGLGCSGVPFAGICRASGGNGMVLLLGLPWVVQVGLHAVSAAQAMARAVPAIKRA